MLNKVKQGNMYGFITHTWNPLGGECKHGCPYCYVKKGMASMSGKYKGEPRLIKKELQTNLGKGNTIFVCNCNDLFGEWIPENWIIEILIKCCDTYISGNTYFFQTKNPKRFENFNIWFPKNSIFCTTIETNNIYTYLRAIAMSELQGRKTVTIEPIMEFDLNEMVTMIKDIKPEWVSIGADSKHCNLPEPSSEKVKELIEELSKFTRVIQKDNLARLLK